MKLRDIIRTANTNLRKSKLRTFLTISAVFMGAFTLMLTIGVGAGLKTYVNKEIGNVGAKDMLLVTPVNESQNPLSGKVVEYNPERKKTALSGFDVPIMQPADIAKIEHQPGILKVTPTYVVVPEYITTGGKKYVSQLNQTIDGLRQPIRTGRMADIAAKNYEVTLPSELVSPLGFASDQAALGQTLTLHFRDVLGIDFEQQATIVGVQQKALINGGGLTGNNSLLHAAFERSRQALPLDQREQYANVFAKFDNQLTPSQLKTLQQHLHDQKYEAKTLDDQLGIIKKVIDGVITFLTIFAAIALAAGSFGIVNTLLMAVQERTREIGLMKALGMNRRRIFLLFSLEATLIGFWGALTGLLAANLLGRLGSQVASKTIFKDFEGLHLFSFPALPMLLIVLLIMVIAFLAATLPAYRASRLDPIEALRYE